MLLNERRQRLEDGIKRGPLGVFVLQAALDQNLQALGSRGTSCLLQQ